MTAQAKTERSSHMLKAFAASAMLAIGLLAGAPAFAGGDLGDTKSSGKPPPKISCPPSNWTPVAAFCPAGWVKVKARVNDLYWRKCETKSWYASTRIAGVRYCTQRFLTQEGEFCAPPGFVGRFWHRSEFDGKITEFNFARAKKADLK